MPSLASLAKRVILANKIARKTSSSDFYFDDRRHARIVPLPLDISNRIPQELYERFLEYLRDDRASLSLCSLVCRAWWPACRYHLRRSLTVLPNVIVGNAEAMFMNCAVPLRGSRLILYGTDDGVYMFERPARTAPRQVLNIPEVTQIDVLEDYNLLVILAGNQVFTYPLDSLDPTEGASIHECTRIASHAAFFKVGTQGGQLLLCVVKFSNVVKILQPMANSPVAGKSTLRLFREFYVPTKVTSVYFLKTKLVVGISHHGFEVVDIGTLGLQSLLDPSVSFPELKSATTIAIYRCDTKTEFFLCYDYFAFYINKAGLISGPESLIRWRRPIRGCVYRQPYIIAYSSSHIEVRYLETGALVQTIWLKHSVLSKSPELIMVKAQDGRLIGLEFTDDERPDRG